MKRNEWLIKQAKEIERLKNRLKKETTRNVPEIYACICKVLMEKHGFDADEINELFCDTQELWNKLVENDTVEDMVTWCEETTGVSLRGEEEE